jgi:hypothetical protein
MAWIKAEAARWEKAAVLFMEYHESHSISKLDVYNAGGPPKAKLMIIFLRGSSRLRP